MATYFAAAGAGLWLALTILTGTELALGPFGLETLIL